MLNWNLEETDNITHMINFLLTYSVSRLSLPGKAESFIIILDLINVGMTQLPVTALKRFLGAVQTNFRGRGYKTLILNASYMIRGTWTMIR